VHPNKILKSNGLDKFYEARKIAGLSLSVSPVFVDAVRQRPPRTPQWHRALRCRISAATGENLELPAIFCSETTDAMSSWRQGPLTEAVAAVIAVPRAHLMTDAPLTMPDTQAKSPALARNGMDKFIDGIELVAAIFVGIVAADIFISVLLRAVPPIIGSVIPGAIRQILQPITSFNPIQIPDSYDFGRLLLGILIFWGIAATSYRGAHISVDLLWASASKRWKRVIDVFATLVLLFVVTTQTIMLFDKVRTTYNDNVLTYDLHLPTWPFFAVAWLGDVSAVVLIAIRTWRLVFNPEKMDAEQAEIKS
jgi:TRAP-type transport system small permease protein